MNTVYEPSNEKKTNYRRLWRKSKEREIMLQNFIQGLLLGVPKSFKDKAEVSVYMKFVEHLRSETVDKV